MKDGIIIKGDIYELKDLSDMLTDSVACEYCDLQDECDLLMHGSNLCEVLHNGGAQHAYRYIGKEEEK